MDVRLLDEQDRKEIEGINDINKKEIITNSNSNKDEIITNINNSESAVIGSNDKAKNEIIKSIDGVKQEDMFANGLYKQELLSSKKHLITGNLEPLYLSIDKNVDFVDTVFDGVERKITGSGPVVLINYKLFDKIYQLDLKIPFAWFGNGEIYLTEKDINEFSRVTIIEGLNSLPSRIYGKSLYIIKNFEARELEASTNDSGRYAGVYWYCKYILK